MGGGPTDLDRWYKMAECQVPPRDSSKYLNGSLESGRESLIFAGRLRPIGEPVSTVLVAKAPENRPGVSAKVVARSMPA